MCALFSRKSLTNYISPEIEVGFSQFGPTLMIGGILSSEKVYLIDHISTTVEIPSKAFKKDFDWFTLQPHTALENKFEIFQTPSKFTLSPNSPYTYNILFADNQCYAEMKTVMLNVSSTWQFFLEKSKDRPYVQIYTEFLEASMTQELNGMLRSLCYWKEASYNLRFCISAKGGESTTEKTFELKEPDIVTLQNNCSDIIANICSQPSVSFDSIKTNLS
ncbi:MAG: hypothetical protein AB1650_09705 [Candidatus Omnitrophota bacterium]